MVIEKDTEILVRDNEREPWEKRIFVRFSNNKVICRNPWRPEKEIEWTFFKILEN